MTTGRTRFTLATAIVLIAVLPALALAQSARGAAGGVRGQARHVAPGPTPASLGIHGFSVVLVVAGPRGASGTDQNVPAAARKALADMKDFLPYQRYQLLDAAWILCCGSNTTQVSGRVRGPDGRDYLYTVDPGDIVGSKLNLRFTMREMQDSAASSINFERLSDTARLEFVRQQAEAARDLDEAVLQLRTIGTRYEVGTATPSEYEAAKMRERRAQQRFQDLQRIGSGGAGQARGAAPAVAAGRAGGGGSRSGTTVGRETMDSSFSIAPGETVVIGTSRINGDQALIAILTAATKPGTGR